MTLSYRIDVEHRAVFVTGTGVIRADDLREMTTKLDGDSEARDILVALADLREAELDFSVSELTSIAKWGGRLFPSGGRGIRRAVVVSRPVHYGLVRMFGHALAPIGQEVAPFKDIPSAREWLGLPVSDEDIQQEI
ncbi:STAS/SEC14 domain-containing protein [bacterium]|nr:STAS/SEC14 domain-containing protein [bacterium]